MRSSPPPEGSRCFTTIGTSSLDPLLSRSIRNPRSAGTWSKTMSMTCCRTSSTGRTAMRTCATLVRTLRIRFAFPISSTSAGIGFWSVGSWSAGASSRRRASSPTDRMIVPASSLSGLSSSRMMRLSRASVNVIWNLPRWRRSPFLSTASMIWVPLSFVPFFDLRSRTRTPVLSTTTLACFREMLGSCRMIWQSSVRPMITSPVANVWVWGVSPSW